MNVDPRPYNAAHVLRGRAARAPQKRPPILAAVRSLPQHIHGIREVLVELRQGEDQGRASVPLGPFEPRNGRVSSDWVRHEIPT